MKTEEQVHFISQTTGFAESTVISILDAQRMMCAKLLREGVEFRIADFGSLGFSDKPQRQGSHPRTGEPTTFQAARVPSFKFSANFKDIIQPDPGLLIVEPEIETDRQPVTETPDVEIANELESEEMWNIPAPDKSIATVGTSELLDWGVIQTTPIKAVDSDRWMLAGKIPKLAFLWKADNI